jgi:hypothetical protein
MRRTIQLAAIALALICAFAPIDSRRVEAWFSGGIYPPLQRTLTPLSNLVPFAIFDLVTIAAGIWVVVAVIAGIRNARRLKDWSVLGAAVARILTAGAVAYLVFLGVWGFNYRRVAMSQRLVVDEKPPDAAAALALGLQAARALNGLHTKAHAAGWPVEPWQNDRMRRAFGEVQNLLTDTADAVPGRLKRSVYGAYFRWSGIDGMVNPFGLEVIRNPDLLPWEIPFIAAHEWAHLAGYADESEANFVGWLICLRSDVAAQYSGWLFLYWQINGESGVDDRRRLAAALEKGPRRDIDAIADRMRRGELPFLRNASWRVYDQYLRANRVEEGVASYGAVVTLILQARFEDGWVPVRRESAARSR